MEDRVLVAYASKYGATVEIAEKVAATLRQAGLTVEVQPVERVDDLSPYQAVVLGSAVYASQWLKPAAAFLEAHEQELAERSTWLFSSGPVGEGDPEVLMKGWRFPENLQPIADRIRPRQIAFFSGKLDPKKLNLAEKLLLKAMKAPVGDYRDWVAITNWAESIAAGLRQAHL